MLLSLTCLHHELVLSPHKLGVFMSNQHELLNPIRSFDSAVKLTQYIRIYFPLINQGCFSMQTLLKFIANCLTRVSSLPAATASIIRHNNSMEALQHGAPA
jgi:hypothetical protein